MFGELKKCWELLVPLVSRKGATLVGTQDKAGEEFGYYEPRLVSSSFNVSSTESMRFLFAVDLTMCVKYVTKLRSNVSVTYADMFRDERLSLQVRI